MACSILPQGQFFGPELNRPGMRLTFGPVHSFGTVWIHGWHTWTQEVSYWWLCNTFSISKKKKKGYLGLDLGLDASPSYNYFLKGNSGPWSVMGTVGCWMDLPCLHQNSSEARMALHRIISVVMLYHPCTRPYIEISPGIGTSEIPPAQKMPGHVLCGTSWGKKKSPFRGRYT